MRKWLERLPPTDVVWQLSGTRRVKVKKFSPYCELGDSFWDESLSSQGGRKHLTRNEKSIDAYEHMSTGVWHNQHRIGHTWNDIKHIQESLTSRHCGLKPRQKTLIGSLYPLKTRSLLIVKKQFKDLSMKLQSASCQCLWVARLSRSSRQANKNLNALINNVLYIISSVTSAMLIMSNTQVDICSYASMDMEARPRQCANTMMTDTQARFRMTFTCLSRQRDVTH